MQIAYLYAKTSVTHVKIYVAGGLEHMKFEFDIKPYQECMNVCVEYIKEEIHQDYFYLNRDFLIKKCFVDDDEYDLSNSAVLESLKTCGGYNVYKYTLPHVFKEIRIEYTGFLSGKTGAYPYVRESISPDFTFIRCETFCYPMFFSDEDDKSFFEFLSASANINITITVKNDFIAVANVKKISSNNENGISRYTFSAHKNNFAIAIAKYKVVNLSVGNFYLLNEIDSNQVKDVITSAHNFMNKYFGEREINTNVNFAAIPHNFGSFANPVTIFVDEVTFTSRENMAHIVHEFIHLGWNVQPDNLETQRIRFFDEAFTSYFQMRVMSYLLHENDLANELAKYVDMYKKQLAKYEYDENVPIIDFGKHEYGDLSYTIGAICLHKLSELVGIDVCDKATRVFLKKYINTPVNMNIFCDEYMKLCDMPELKEFFNDWIYSIKGPKLLLASL